MKSIAATSKYGTLEYKFERLPSKLKPWYKYAMDFVRVTRQKTPRIIYANNLLKCYFMENDPLNSIEVEFTQLYQATKSLHSKKQVKVTYSKSAVMMSIIFKESPLIPGVSLRSL